MQFWFAVLDDLKLLCSLRPAEWKVYMVLLSEIRAGRNPTRKRIAQLAGVDRRHVGQALPRLIQAGLVSAEKSSQRRVQFSSPVGHQRPTQESTSGTPASHSVGHQRPTQATHIRKDKLQKLASARAKAEPPAESPNPAMGSTAALATFADTGSAIAQSGEVSSSADYPLATALLTAEGANPKLTSRILALPALQGLGDAQVAWCLRAARKPHQQGPGLYLFTLPELVARQRMAAGEKAQMPIVFEPICKACNDLGFVPANGNGQAAGETVDEYLDRCRKCGCATAAGMAENAATLARVASEGGGRNVTKGATR